MNQGYEQPEAWGGAELDHSSSMHWKGVQMMETYEEGMERIK